MSYINAPATKLLATRCAVCSRPLLDAKSVEVGIGPICRERHGWDEETANMDEETRKAANVIVYRVALDPTNEQERAAACAALRLMGLKKLPDRIEFRGGNAPVDEVVEIKRDTLPALPAGHYKGRYRRALPAKDGYVVYSPYKPAAVEAFRNIRGRVWLREQEANFIPLGERRALWDLLQRYYPGMTLVTSDGTSVIPGAQNAA